MDSQTEDVIIMAHVEALGVLLSVVCDPYGSHVVHDLTRLGVEQVAPAIITPVAAKQKKKAQMCTSLGMAARQDIQYFRILGSLEAYP